MARKPAKPAEAVADPVEIAPTPVTTDGTEADVVGTDPALPGSEESVIVPSEETTDPAGTGEETDGNAPEGGEVSQEASDLSAVAEGQTQPLGTGEAPTSPETVAKAEVNDEPELEIAPTITVTCLKEGGRRRAGRRWDAGHTVVLASDLTAYQLGQLRGDPLFRVSESDADLPCKDC